MNAVTITSEFTVPRIARAGQHQMQSVCIPVLICTVMLVFGFLTFDAHAEARGRAAMGAAQAKANEKLGSRRVPAKVIPVPSELDPGTAALVAAPYSKIWNLNPPNAAAWRVVQKQVADEAVPMLAKTRAELGVSIEETSVGGVRAFILTPRQIPEAHKNQLIFHIHGGGYVFGTGESGTYEAAMIAAYDGYKVLSIDYRMPPDAPYPAALDDVTTEWRAVAATTNPRSIAVEGTSSGGALTLALMLRIKAEKLPMPAAIAPGSPWSDMTETGDSYKTNEWVDNVVVTYNAYLANAAQFYANGHDLKEPGLSPIYGDFSGLPPAILTAGTRDLFLSNTVRSHRKLRRAGVEAQLQVYEGLSHAQYTLDASAPVTKEIFEEITRFFDAHLAN